MSYLGGNNEPLVTNWRRSSLTKARFANLHLQKPMVGGRNKWTRSSTSAFSQPEDQEHGMDGRSKWDGYDRHSRRRGQEGFIISGDAVAMGVLGNPTPQRSSQNRQGSQYFRTVTHDHSRDSAYMSAFIFRGVYSIDEALTGSCQGRHSRELRN